MDCSSWPNALQPVQVRTDQVECSFLQERAPSSRDDPSKLKKGVVWGVATSRVPHQLRSLNQLPRTSHVPAPALRPTPIFHWSNCIDQLLLHLTSDKRGSMQEDLSHHFPERRSAARHVRVSARWRPAVGRPRAPESSPFCIKLRRCLTLHIKRRVDQVVTMTPARRGGPAGLAPAATP